MWISVSERLPGPDEEVPFSWVTNGNRYISFGMRPKDDNYSGWPDTTDVDIDGWPTDRFGVTHWFELPPVPEEALKRAASGLLYAMGHIRDMAKKPRKPYKADGPLTPCEHACKGIIDAAKDLGIDLGAEWGHELDLSKE